MNKGYVAMAEAAKMALRAGREEDAMKIREKMRDLRKAGKVSEDEMIAAAYI